jgi:hypothetical protein
MPFTHFEDFGKAVNDVFKLSKTKPDQLTLKAKTSAGFKLASTVAINQGPGAKNSTSAEFNNLSQDPWVPYLDSVKVELSPNASDELGVTLGFKTQLDKLTVKGASTSNQANVGTLEVQHVFDNRLGFSASLDSNQVLSANVAAQVEGLSVGGSAQVERADDNFNVTDFTAGAQYTHEDYLTGTFQANRKLSDFVGSVFVKAQNDVEMGVQMDYFHARNGDNYDDGFSTKFSVGGKYTIDDATSVAVKATSNGEFNSCWTHQLKCPDMKFCFYSAHTFPKSNFFQGLTASQLGFTLQFGK